MSNKEGRAIASVSPAAGATMSDSPHQRAAANLRRANNPNAPPRGAFLNTNYKEGDPH